MLYADIEMHSALHTACAFGRRGQSGLSLCAMAPEKRRWLTRCPGVEATSESCVDWLLVQTYRERAIGGA